jgi:hypothetical protein
MLLHNVAALTSSLDVKFPHSLELMIWTCAFNAPPKAAKACFFHTAPNGHFRGCAIFFEQIQIPSLSHSTHPFLSSLSPTANHGQTEKNTKEDGGEEPNQRPENDGRGRCAPSRLREPVHAFLPACLPTLLCACLRLCPVLRK